MLESWAALTRLEIDSFQNDEYIETFSNSIQLTFPFIGKIEDTE